MASCVALCHNPTRQAKPVLEVLVIDEARGQTCRNLANRRWILDPNHSYVTRLKVLFNGIHSRKSVTIQNSFTT
jgi:hypothetical protein